ncbi:MAG: adenosylmethionine--8-amino-7-oxononanoate transaminase [Deltaproteobacteria bacterium RIFCSPLOWO2_12_FULL_43_16]|nr:MAG: adenosylmethionine--8-amino-7-oxononanoate transaminase [Deltaproteobacteria bacterium GWA2_43_19]OGQ12186.1 MAG: adenosylmethionine--8-amino-7-oxononanoate transaminase [Deltaproteobacteria bacterium RIFCSPHIGHO2_02_FULL_43_33]OGQ59763.1 MAG: adenosylmethionine--8-amino-7-oxononanoate transaminase [Deltaproteobacteria bacterium RIFCSPLOWO2_12_FULL_43_16]
MKTKRNKRLEKIDKKHLWHPFTQMREWEKETLLIIERGEGNYLIDTNGKKYLDGVSSLWVNVHGHRKKEINDAIKKQIDKISHSTLLGLGNVPSIELAEKLVQIAPKGLTKVFYSDNGSTAVEIALKMAYQYWEQQSGVRSQKSEVKKTKFISFTGAYHGDTLGSMSVGEIDVFVEKHKPLLFATYKADYPYCYRCPTDKKYPSCKIACIKSFEDILKKHHREIAACIIEPIVQGAAGMIVAPHGFLKKVKGLCTRYNILLIADEVATGFGRTGKLFACEHENVMPDFLCLAKGITGGYLPLAATLTTNKIYRAFLGEYTEMKQFFHGHTYTGNPLGCAAAIGNLQIFKNEKTVQMLRPKIKLLAELLEGFKNLPHVGDVRQKGLIAGIELVKDKKTKEPYFTEQRIGHKICIEARKYGLIIRPLGDTIVIMPPLSITMAEIKKMIDVIYRCIRQTT